MTTNPRRLSAVCSVAAILVLGVCGHASALGRMFDAYGADAGSEPRVKVYLTTSLEVADFLAFDPAFRGGVRVAVGDIDGDGLDDIVAAAGFGSSLVRVFPGICVGPFTPPFDCPSGMFTVDSSRTIAEFFAFGSFAGGVYVAVANFDQSNDAGVACPRNEIVVAAGEGGGPHVKILRNATVGGSCPVASPVALDADAPIVSFLPYVSGFRGGVRVSATDLNNDLFADLVVGAGPGGGSHVQVFRNLSTETTAFGGLDTAGPAASFFAFDPAFIGGVYVGTAFFDPDNRKDLVVGAGPGGGPAVVVFRNTGTGTALGFDTTTPLASFYAFDSTFTGGVRVGSIASGGILLAAPGPGGPGVVRGVQRRTDGLAVDTMFGASPFSLFTYFGMFISQ